MSTAELPSTTEPTAVVVPVDQPVRPRAWWVAPVDDSTDGAVWTCEPTAKDLQWLREQTGRDAVVIELGDVSASRAAQDDAYVCGRNEERERCAALCESAPFTGNTFPVTQMEQLRRDIAAAILGPNAEVRRPVGLALTDS